MERYLVNLDRRLQANAASRTPQVFLMQSNGGLMRITMGARFPNQTLMSGRRPAWSPAARLRAPPAGRNLVTFDIGGTSTDISVIADGRASETSERPHRRAGHRHADAGGAHARRRRRHHRLDRPRRIDEGRPAQRRRDAGPGLLRPRRHGADRDRRQSRARRARHQQRARRPHDARPRRSPSSAIMEGVARPLGLDLITAAAGILKIVNTNMAVDLRLAFQSRGEDPRRFALLAFGGAGPLHAGPSRARSRHPRRARAAASGTDQRHGPAADRRAPSLSALRRRAAVVLSGGRDQRHLRRAAPPRLARHRARKGSTSSALPAQAAVRPALPAPGLPPHGRRPGRRGDAGAQAARSSPPSTSCTGAPMAPARPRRTPSWSRCGSWPRSRSRICGCRRSRPGGRVAEARIGQRPLYDLARGDFRRRATSTIAPASAPAIASTGPAIVEQYDSTTVVLAGQTLTRRRCRQSHDHRASAMKLDPITTEVDHQPHPRDHGGDGACAVPQRLFADPARVAGRHRRPHATPSGRVIMVGGGLQYHSLLYTRAVESVCERYPRRRDARRRQLHLQRSLQGRQLARARHRGDHADLSSAARSSPSAPASPTRPMSAVWCPDRPAPPRAKSSTTAC